MDNVFDDLFDMSFVDEDGYLNRVRSFSRPEDFIRESIRQKDQADKFERMANKREEKFGPEDKRAMELKWAANMLREHAENNNEMARIIKRSD